MVGTTRIASACDYRDYRRVDGVLVPHTLVQRSEAPRRKFEMRTEYTVVSHTLHKPSEQDFVLPDEVSALLRQRAQSQPSSASSYHKTP